MPSVFILRAGNDGSSLHANSQLYDGIKRENDQEFAMWFDAIMNSLNRTGNTNNGLHQRVWDKISNMLQDPEDESENDFAMSCKVPVLIKNHKAIKVILLGCSSSGKTRFFQYTIGEPVKDTTTTTGCDFREFDFQYQDTLVKLNLWDTAGRERFNAITKSYYRGSDGALLLVDLSSFESSDDWERNRSYFKNLMQTLNLNIGIKIPCLLVGTKWDLKKKLPCNKSKHLKSLQTYIQVVTGYFLQPRLVLT